MKSLLTLLLLLTFASCATTEGSAGLAPCQTVWGDYDKECLLKKEANMVKRVDTYLKEVPSQVKFREEAIRAELVIGMDKGLMRIILGDRYRLNITTTKHGIYEQCVYQEYYVYLKNNIITAISSK